MIVLSILYANINKEGRAFIMVLVHEFVIGNNIEGNKAISDSKKRFPYKDILLTAQDAFGRYCYYGDNELIEIAMSLQESEIHWKILSAE